jgi:hypothetical protein
MSPVIITGQYVGLPYLQEVNYLNYSNTSYHLPVQHYKKAVPQVVPPIEDNINTLTTSTTLLQSSIGKVLMVVSMKMTEFNIDTYLTYLNSKWQLVKIYSRTW